MVPALKNAPLIVAFALVLPSALGIADERRGSPHHATLPTAPAPARLLEGMGDYHFQVSSSVPLAQRYFDQGLMLAWGFNFAEAVRSFREATRLDPRCAMCYWGVAYARGPTIDRDTSGAAAAEAFEAMQQAVGLAGGVDKRERALIEAIAKRYERTAGADRGPLDDTYAKAMSKVAKAFPDDPDVLTLFADALMASARSGSWSTAKSRRRSMPSIPAVLERALDFAPHHPGANHFYIHVMEGSPNPERALASAKRLETLVPGAGHLVHMAGHVYFRLGDYNGAIRANQKAVAADRAYLDTVWPDPAYVTGYVLHNYHFLWVSAVMAGRREVAWSAANELSRNAPGTPADAPMNGTQQHFLVLPLYTQVRFGEWEAILNSTRPTPATSYTDGVWHYARGMALVRTGRVDEARHALDRLEAARVSAASDTAAFRNMHPVGRLLSVCGHILNAEVAAARGDYTAAISLARAAVKTESQLEPDEPPAAHMPARHILGALLLEAGRPKDAEAVYRHDLKIHPLNGWSLAGLAASLSQQGRTTAAAEVRERFTQCLSNADVTITGSRL